MPNWKKVIVSGSDAALNSLNVTSHFTASGINYPTVDGTVGQVIITDGAGNLSFSPVENTAIVIKNVSGGTIAKGTPCYITSSGTSGNLAGVWPADASNPARMPAGVIAGETLNNGDEGVGLINGYIGGVDTSAFNAGDSIYVKAGGGYTNVRPTGSSILVQKLGNVEKSAINGSGVINGPAYYNDLPNIQSGYTWVGNNNGVAVAIATSSIQNVVSSSFASTASFATTSISSSFASTASNITPVISNDVDTRVITANGNGTLNAEGNLTFNGQTLSVLYGVGDEGGEMLLGKPATNTTLTGSGVTVDVFQNRLRFFEQGGTARGFYLDITTGGSGASTNLASGGGTVTSVGTTGTVNGITLTGGPITGAGTITLGGTLSGITPSQLATSSIMIGSTNITLGATASSLTGLTSINATSFTGSLLGTASYATQALSASYALTAGSTTAVAGTTNYVSKFTSGTTIGDSQIFDNGTNVGIGTATPGAKLSVNGNTQITGSITSTGQISSRTNHGITINPIVQNFGSYMSYVSSTGTLFVGIDDYLGSIFNNGADARNIYSSGNAPIVISTNSTASMAITSAGNVGIGTINPSTKLEVSGSTRFTGNSSITGSLTVSGSTQTMDVVPLSSYLYSVGSVANPYATINAVNHNSPANLSMVGSQNTYIGAGNTYGIGMFQTTRNVLIQNGGTYTDAGYRLDVNGTFRATGTITTDGHGYFNQGIWCDIYRNRFGAEVFRITLTSNNMLVGTTTDSGYRLDVSGSTRFTGNSIITGSLTVSEGITGSLLGTASYATQALSASWAPSTGGSSFPYTGSALITGSLGVTGSFSTQINDNAFGYNAAFYNANAGSSALSGLALINASQNPATIFQLNSNGDLGIYNSATTGKINLFTNATTRMTIDSSGNVGIGSPPTNAQRLDVSAGHITTYDGSAKEGKITFNNGVGGVRWDQLSSKLHLMANSTDAVTISGSGNVGIGDTTPSYKLDVAGDIGVSSNIIDTTFGTFKWDSSGYLYAGNYGDPNANFNYRIDAGIASITDQSTINTNWAGEYKYNGQVLANVIAGETFTRGQLLYLDTNSKWSRVDATTTRATKLLGIALTDGVLDDVCTVLLDGLIGTESHKQVSSAVPGLPLYIDTTAGIVTETAPSGSGEIVRLIGHNIYDAGSSTVIIRFQPDNTWIEL
jgi:hypothetical protein